MDCGVIPGAMIVATALACLLCAEARHLPRVRRTAKSVASAGFLLAALHAPALRAPSGPGWLLFAALAAAAVGDVLLSAEGSARFIAGMGAFSLAHLVYIAWFWTRGVHAPGLAVAAIVMAVIGHLAWRWLEPHLAPRLRVPVRLYTALVSLMTAFAIAYAAQIVTEAASATALLPAAGGVLFCVSDAAVARQRFVTRGFINTAWGVPVYYLAQLLFAAAVL